MNRENIKIGDLVTLKPSLLGAGRPMTVTGLPGKKLVRTTCKTFGDGLNHADNLVPYVESHK